MLETVLVFAAALAYAAIEHARRRRRAQILRSKVARERPPRPPSRASDPPPRWYDGARLDGGYLVGALLGRGAFGDVHVVEHRGLGRRWAAKVIRRDLIANAAHRRSLLRELAHGFRVTGHPHIVRTEMFRSFGDEIAVFSELVEGGTLSAALSSPLLTEREQILEVGLQLAWALEAIHRAGLVHGDVKPNNVLRTRAGTVKLADLGLSSLSRAGEHGAAAGTLLYRSPEQAKRRPVTTASDAWSWAVTMIAMLLGDAPPHAGGEAAAQTLTRIRRRDAPVHVAADDQLCELLAGCLRKQPEQRTTMTEIADALSARLGRASAPRVRPSALFAVSTHARIADELAAHTEALQCLLVEVERGGPAVQDAALCSALVKADCHRRHGDVAGAATTLASTLDATPDAAARLRAGVWLELGVVHHERGAPAAAAHAFDSAASMIDDPLLRARACRGTAIAAWTAHDRESARASARRAVAIAAHAIDVAAAPERGEARYLHAASLLTLADMLREPDHLEEYEACVAHALATCETLDDDGRQILIRSLLMSGDFAAVRAQLDMLAHPAGAAARSPIRDGTRERAAKMSNATALLAAIVDLEEARALAAAEQPVDALERIRRARDVLRPLAERGITVAALPLAVVEVHLAWLLRAARRGREHPIDGALAILDEAARTGRRDAAALAQWARAQRMAGAL